MMKWLKHNKNPLSTWWKARKVFKRPKCHFMCGKDIWFYGLYILKEYYNPILHIHISDLGWKWKYEEIRHEWDPYIQIVFFRKWYLVWVFNWVTKKDKGSSTRSAATWEAILDYLYNNKTLKECIDDHVWNSRFGGDTYHITIHKNIRRKCLKKLNL